nr:phosphate ABC transporter ATP-binding protein [uncultured Bacillus sp.]
MEILISIEQVIKNNKQGQTILNDISAKIMDGELITIIGPSGSGKSTFLSLVNRMTDPDSGSLFFKGVSYSEIDVLQLRRKIGIVFQLPTMLSGTVRDNLAVGPSLFREQLGEAEIDRLLDQVGLPAGIKNQDARSLSGGQMQRISLARTLANRPEILLLDEVTSSLDPHSTEEIEKLIKEIHKNGKTILWVTHNLTQAKNAGQFTWVFANGKIVEQDRTKDLFEAPRHSITRDFIEASFAKEALHS